MASTCHSHFLHYLLRTAPRVAEASQRKCAAICFLYHSMCLCYKENSCFSLEGEGSNRGKGEGTQNSIKPVFPAPKFCPARGDGRGSGWSGGEGRGPMMERRRVMEMDIFLPSLFRHRVPKAI